MGYGEVGRLVNSCTHSHTELLSISESNDAQIWVQKWQK